MSDELAATPGRFRKLTGAPAAVLRALLITLTVLGSLWALEVHHHFEVTFFKQQYLALFLALALGSVVSSAIIIESQFGLPGLGRVLDSAIRSNDFLVIYGIVLFVTIAVATLMVLMEFIYPLLDPRIRNE